MCEFFSSTLSVSLAELRYTHRVRFQRNSFTSVRISFSSVPLSSKDRTGCSSTSADVLIGCFCCRYEVKDDGKGGLTLVIKNLKLEDEGEYTCQIGRRDTSCKLTVDEGA